MSRLISPSRLISVPHANPIQQVLHLRLAQNPAQAYVLYLPNANLRQAPVLVCVHGISRNAEEQINCFSDYAEANGVILIAPIFDDVRFPDYQRLGRSKRGQRADLMLTAILAEVSQHIGVDIHRVSLFGYSGGAQFAHRFMMAYPERINAVVVAAAGWYTFPDSGCRYPRGTAHVESLMDMSFDLDRFLQIPVCALVGEHDTIRDSTLRSGPKLERQQGLTRKERAHRWICAMREAAKERGYSTLYYFELLPKTGHSFTMAMKEGDMGERVFRFLFPASQSRSPLGK